MKGTRYTNFLLAGPFIFNNEARGLSSCLSIYRPRYCSSVLLAKKASNEAVSAKAARVQTTQPLSAKAAKSQTALPSSNQSKLSNAVKSIVEVASIEIDSKAQKKAAAELKDLSDNVNTLRQEVVVLKDTVHSIKSLLESERRDMRIFRAMELTHIDSFRYYHDGWEDSSELAKEALECFLIGYYFILPDDAETEDGDTVQFRAKFKDQIRNLIGRQPRM
eukprot:scaffold241970_cov132-Cyclotella_meneghiniana.AAC.1